MPVARPARQVCPVCALDDSITVSFVDGVWVLACTSRSHPPFEWRPAEQHRSSLGSRSGIGEELGVYDDLYACVDCGFVEYGIIEYRLWQRSPGTYTTLVDRYGHRAIAPRAYTASSFLGGALGQLWREGAIEGVWAPATGYWSYNGQIGTYAASGTPESADVLSWEAFAASIGVHPTDWPPLGFVAA